MKAADKIEVCIACLAACGSSALTAEYAALAREFVVQRTLTHPRMPDKVEHLVWEDSNPNGVTSIYVY